jgi:FkbM family methyltransferase
VTNIAERLSGTRIMRPGKVGIVFEEEHLKRFFSRFGVDCVFDVGANSGQYAGMLRQRVGYRGPIISFEPVPELAAHLRSRAATTPNWHVEELALDSTARQTRLNVMANNQFSSLPPPTSADIAIFEEVNAVMRTVEVRTATLCDSYRKHKQLRFSRPYLKLDTQGNDMNVVRDAGDCIWDFVGLHSELSIRKIYEGSEGFAKAIAFYNSKGFALSALVPSNEGHLPVLVEMDCIIVSGSDHVRCTQRHQSDAAWCQRQLENGALGRGAGGSLTLTDASTRRVTRDTHHACYYWLILRLKLSQHPLHAGERDATWRAQGPRLRQETSPCTQFGNALSTSHLNPRSTFAMDIAKLKN